MGETALPGLALITARCISVSRLAPADAAHVLESAGLLFLSFATLEYLNPPDWHSASKLMSRRIELRRNKGGWNNDGTEAYYLGAHAHRRNPRRTGRGNRPFAFHQAKQRSTQSRRICSGTGRRSYYDSAGLRRDRQKSDHHGDQASGVAPGSNVGWPKPHLIS